MKYSREELERLMEYIDSGEERIKESKRIVCKNTFDFNIWYKYSIPEERNVYPSVLGVNTAIGRMIHKKMRWLSSKEYEGLVLDVDFILLSAKHLSEDYEELTTEDIEEIKREIVKLNFGSMINKW